MLGILMMSNELINKYNRNSFIQNISVKEEIENQNRKKAMADKIIKKEISIYDLNDEEVIEMTAYFTEDIKKIDEELLRIKNHIKKMRKELNS